MSDSSRGKRRGAKTREAVLQAARRLFSQHGYESTTTRMIAREAGVAEGTIYIHFPSKRHLLFALLEQATLPALRDIFNGASATQDAEVLRAFFRDRLHFGEEYADLIRTLLPQAMYDEQLAEHLVHEVVGPAGSIVKDYLARGMQEGVFREIEVDIAARMLVGAFWFTVLFDHLLACSGEKKEALLKRHTAEEYSEAFANLFLEGIRR